MPMGVTVQVGLSPRARGNLARVESAIMEEGSIPACAGEPRWPRITRTLPGVYPRVRGGTQNPRTPIKEELGLSPRARGNRAENRAGVGSPGSIPACAGEPQAWSACQREPRVYPRVRGGTRFRRCMSSTPKGLSPRARGNHCVNARKRHFDGSIPACAGEPTPPRLLRPSCRVYPRVRGGTAKRVSWCHPFSGLSPRARGNRTLATLPNGRKGSIPACAGEPR